MAKMGVRSIISPPRGKAPGARAQRCRVWRPNCRGAWALLVLLLCLPCLALAQEARSLDTIMTGVATELAQRFPPVTGEVIKVEPDQVYLSVGGRENLMPGMQLVLFRAGAPLKHPTTGETLGQLEQELGIVTVTQVAERYAVAAPTHLIGAQAIQVGDKIRITAGRIAVGLLPLVNQTRQTIADDVFADALQRALEATERFRVASQDRVSIWLINRGTSPQGVPPSEFLPELAQALQLSYLLMPTVKDLRGTLVLELLLLAPAQPQTPVATASAILPPQVLVQRPPEPPAPMREAVPLAPSAPPPPQQPAPAPPTVAQKVTPEAPPVAQPAAPAAKQELRGVFKTPPPQRAAGSEWNIAASLTKLRDIPQFLVSIDGGDLDGDGTIEVAMIMGAQVSLYRFVEGEKLDLVATFTATRQGKLLSVQLMRLGATQPIGLVVNQQIPGHGMESFILALRDKKLVLWQEHIYDILLAVDTDGDGVKETLWGQPFHARDFFLSGVMRQYMPVNGALQPQQEVLVPYMFRATGAALAKLSANGQRTLVFVDSQNMLRVFHNKEDLWKSPEKVGGSYTFGEIEQTISRDVMKFSFFFEAIPLAQDLDGDGIDEVLVVSNASSFSFVPNLQQYSGGSIALLREENYGYSLSPISPQFNGIVSGIIAVPGTPPALLIAITKPKGFFGQGGTTTLFLSRRSSNSHCMPRRLR